MPKASQMDLSKFDYKKYGYMDLHNGKYKLHPQAGDLLFQHYRSTRRIFYDVLGLLEIDYVSIALLNAKQELLFFSSMPSVEFNLIEQHVWEHDPCLQPAFLMSNEILLWDNKNRKPLQQILRHYKLTLPGFSQGVSVPGVFNGYRVVYSFALKSTDILIQNRLVSHPEKLVSMGNYCLQKIMNTIPIPECHSKPNNDHVKHRR